jgi:hypothetical protein
MIEVQLLNLFVGEIAFGLRGEHIQLLDEDNEVTANAYQIVLGLIFVQLTLVLNVNPVDGD